MTIKMPRILPILLQNSKEYQKRRLANLPISSIVGNVISVERIRDNVDSPQGKCWYIRNRSYSTERNTHVVLRCNILCTSKSIFLEQTPNYRFNTYLFSTTTTSHSNKKYDPQTPNEKSTDDQNTKTTKVKALAQKGATTARKGGSKIKELLQRYGWYFGGTYFCVWSITLGSMYAAIDSGLIDTQTITSFLGGELGNGEEEVDAVKMVVGILDQYEWTRPYSSKVAENPKITTLGVAWLATKILEPFRIVVAGYLTPKVARILGKQIKQQSSE